MAKRLILPHSKDHVDDLSSTKVHPAVCLTNPIGPQRHVIVAFYSGFSFLPPVVENRSCQHYDYHYVQTVEPILQILPVLAHLQTKISQKEAPRQ